MYTSDTDKGARRAAGTAFAYLLASLFLMLFGAVYEANSHEVYSFYMLYAFAFPLVGGVLPFSAIDLFMLKWYPCASARMLYHCGIATLTAGSVIRGILDIYGTTNALMRWYWPAGAGLILSGILICLLRARNTDPDGRSP